MEAASATGACSRAGRRPMQLACRGVMSFPSAWKGPLIAVWMTAQNCEKLWGGPAGVQHRVL